jgi:hypothetical protein
MHALRGCSSPTGKPEAPDVAFPFGCGLAGGAASHHTRFDCRREEHGGGQGEDASWVNSPILRI